MGRGGGHSGGHHSSHRSSSHSHHSSHRSSGGYRSSGRSYHSSGRYGRSHHSSGGSYYDGDGRRRSGCGGGCGTLFSFLLIFVMIGAFGYIKTGRIPFIDELGFGITRSTVVREMLPEDDCDPIDTWYQDDWGTWITADSSEETDLIEGLEYFYEKTGVQPYLWITGEEVGSEYQSEGSLEDWAEDKYVELFGEDEGHVLIVFREYPDESGDYICTVTPGYDASTVVLDDEAREILLDYIDYYYEKTEYNEGEFFEMALKKAADRMMTKQLTNREIITIVAVVAIAAIVIVIIVNVRKKRKIAVAKEKTRQKEEAARQAQAEAVQAQAEAETAKTEFAHQVYNDELEKQYVGVVCPSCGASGNKIRLGTVGYCQYCGTAIKAVGAEGSVAQAADPAEAAQAQAAAQAQDEFLAGQGIPRPEGGDGYGVQDTPDNGGM
ncbi:MAG: hypothetical protein II496_04445 [Clostridiales bacterium]|nr:hypothetical protein [Clostridiales bacterium]